jgi:predicted dehydrogenase
MKKISWGIIGCGDVTEIKSGPAFNLVPNSELVAVMRRDQAKAADYAQRHQVSKWYSDAKSLINDDEVNAIYIATPPAYHKEYTLKAFKAGKPVYVEKPMALDSAESIRMMEAAEKYSCKLSVAHYRRAQPKFLKISSLIKEKVLGDIISADITFLQANQPGTEITWRTNPAISGGGLFHDLAPHQLDLMLYFFGQPITTEGISLNKANLYLADDYVNAKMLFQDDISFKGLWDFNARIEDEVDICEIRGTKGKIRFSVFGNLCELTIDDKITSLDFEYLAHVQQPMIEQVVNYFLSKNPNPCSANDAVEIMKMIDKVTEK